MDISRISTQLAQVKEAATGARNDNLLLVMVSALLKHPAARMP